jgi:hypothetical protein
MYRRAQSAFRLTLVLLGGSLLLQSSGCGGPDVMAVPDYPPADFSQRDPGQDWSADLPALLPALLSCLEAAPGQSSRVVVAKPVEAGRASVRLVNAERETYDCRAPLAGGQVLTMQLAGRNLPRQPGEARSIFTPVSGRPLEGACYRHESVPDAAGVLQGWLSYDLC